MISKNEIDNLLIRIVLLFPSTVLLQGLPGLEWINKCIIAILILLMLQSQKDQRAVYMPCILCGILSVISLLLSNSAYLRIQDLFYFPLFVLYNLYWGGRTEEFGTTLRKNLNFGGVAVLIWFLLVAVSLLFRNSYVYSELDTVFFRSFSNDTFRLASSCVLIMVILHIMAYYKKPIIFLLESIPMLAIFAAGTRIYLLVGAGIFFLSFYLLCRKKRIFWISLLPIMAVMVVAVLNSSIMDKFVLVALSKETLYGNYWDAFTSGRSVFWQLNLEAFGQLPFWKQLIGNGLSFSYEVTGTQYVKSIWSHNDYIHVIISYGWLGLGLYLYCFFQITEQFRKTYLLKCLPYLGAVALCMGNAFLNGLYFYSAAMLAIPFLLYAMSLDRSKDGR